MALAFVSGQFTVIVNNLLSIIFKLDYIRWQWILYMILALFTYWLVFFRFNKERMGVTLYGLLSGILLTLLLHFTENIGLQLYYLTPLIVVLFFMAVYELSSENLIAKHAFYKR